jgi:hypothetical protein
MTEQDSRRMWGRIPLSLNLDKRVRLRHLRVYAAIASFAGKKHECYPSLRAISDRSGVPANKISATTADLQKFGYLRVERQGRMKSNLYHILSDYPVSGYSPTPRRGESLPPTTGGQKEQLKRIGHADHKVEAPVPAAGLTPAQQMRLEEEAVNV